METGKYIHAILVMNIYLTVKDVEYQDETGLCNPMQYYHFLREMQR